jgi:biotin carboxyl carrier protein
VSWAEPETADRGSAWISPWNRRSAVRVTTAVRPARISLHVTDDYGDAEAELRVGHDRIVVELDGAAVEFPRSPVGADPLAAFIHRRHGAAVAIAHGGLALTAPLQPRIDMPRAAGQLERSGNVVDAPLHGVVSKLYVAVGDAVEKGTPVLQMEAMKLVHTLKAPLAGRIQSIRCAEGDTVPAGAVLVEISPEADEEKR